MAYLTLMANIDAARHIAQRAFGRIESRQEKEKMSVQMTFLKLEFKYGSQNSLDNKMRWRMLVNKTTQSKSTKKFVRYWTREFSLQSRIESTIPKHQKKLTQCFLRCAKDS